MALNKPNQTLPSLLGALLLAFFLNVLCGSVKAQSNLKFGGGLNYTPYGMLSNDIPVEFTIYNPQGQDVFLIKTSAVFGWHVLTTYNLNDRLDVRLGLHFRYQRFAGFSPNWDSEKNTWVLGSTRQNNLSSIQLLHHSRTAPFSINCSLLSDHEHKNNLTLGIGCSYNRSNFNRQVRYEGMNFEHGVSDSGKVVSRLEYKVRFRETQMRKFNGNFNGLLSLSYIGKFSKGRQLMCTVSYLVPFKSERYTDVVEYQVLEYEEDQRDWDNITRELSWESPTYRYSLNPKARGFTFSITYFPKTFELNK